MADAELERLQDELRAAGEVVAALKRRLTLAEDSTAAGRFALHKAMARLEDAVQDRARELEASEARYRALFEHSPDMLLLVDERGRIAAANRACVEAFGGGEVSLRGTPLAELFASSPGRGGALDPDAGEQERTLHTGRDVTATVARLPGAERVLLVSLRDATAKRALVHAQRLAALGQLAAGVAHEINNPLAVLQMGLEQLAVRLGEHAQLRDDALVLVEHCERIARIVENLNDFARPRTPDRALLHVRELVLAAAALARRALDADRFTLDVEPAELAVYADRGQIEQVLVNLLSNAGRAAGATGRVLVRARALGPAAKIEVQDDGPGIDPVLLPQIFSPFVTGTGGMGLGLSICWSLVQENGGTLRAENLAPRGALVALTLPREADDAPRPEPVATPAPQAGLRVLCVEDEPVLRSLLAAMLRELGHVPTTVRSAEDALDALDSGAFDVVLTDIQLPGETGHWLRLRIDAQHPTLSERVILMSGHFQTIPTGQPCLQKPFGFEELGQALAEIAP